MDANISSHSGLSGDQIQDVFTTLGLSDDTSVVPVIHADGASSREPEPLQFTLSADSVVAQTKP